MLVLLTLLAFLSPETSRAETLSRTWKNPRPAALKLTKNFYETKRVPSTCTIQYCEDVDYRECKEVCSDEPVGSEICQQQMNCTWNQDSQQQECSWQDICTPGLTYQRQCHQACEWQRGPSCSDIDVDCTKEQKILVRSWKVLFQPKFDATALPGKGKDEKFTVSLAGDERNPRLEVKVNKSPFKYEAFTPRFSSDAKSVELEFRVRK